MTKPYQWELFRVYKQGIYKASYVHIHGSVGCGIYLVLWYYLWAGVEYSEYGDKIAWIFLKKKNMND